MAEAAPNQTVAAQSSDAPQVTLYWLEKSRSQRILWLLTELSIPHQITVFHRDPKTHFAPPELKKIHPLGKSPIVSIKPATGGPDIVLAESGLIAEYLTEHFGSGTTLVPTRWREGMEGKVGGETEEWLRYKYLLYYCEGSLMPYLGVLLIAMNIRNAPVPFFIRPITNRIATGISTNFLNPNFATTFAFLEGQLKTSPGGGQYMCGSHLTAADILMSFPLIAAKGRGGLLPKEKYPLLRAYVDRLEEEEGYKKAVGKIVELEGNFSAMI